MARRRKAKSPRTKPLSWRKIVASFCGTLIGGVFGVWALSFLWPQNFEWSNRIYIAVCAAIFIVRVFQFYLAIALLVPVLIALAVRARRVAAAGLVAALVMALPMLRDLLPKRPPDVAGDTLRVMSVNLYIQNTDPQALRAQIEQFRPDVILLIEMNWPMRMLFDGPLAEQYPYRSFRDVGGSAVMVSRLPFREEPVIIGRRAGMGFIPRIIELNGREVVILGQHFISPAGLWAVERNRQQVAAARAIIDAEARPVIFAGDLNMTPQTPNFRELRAGGLRSSHEIAGFGRGVTWRPIWRWSRHLPGIRIDHILVRPPLTVSHHAVGDDIGSDHLPVIAEIGFRAK
jgi:endonuclease/exonuclease/phosphatase (EEP) superfamily protein YafD